MPLVSAIREIRQKHFSPVYVLHGPESFLAEEFLSLARREMIDPDFSDLNVSVYDCTETSLGDILQDAETLPFMGEHRLVIARQAYFLTGSKPPSKVESDPDALLGYLQNPPAYTTLILHTDAEKLDERKKLVKTLQQKAKVIPFSLLRDADLYAWVERQADKFQASIDRPQAMKLVERVGSELRLLDKEVEKLALYVGNGGKITDQVIEDLCARTLEQDVFALIEQVASGRLDRALRMLYDCMKTGEEPIKLLSLFARQFRMLLQVRQLAPRGYSQQQIAGMIKMHPYAVKKAMEQARHFSEDSLKKLLLILAEEDFRMKSGQVDKRLALELFITRAHEARNRTAG
ncbi:DNA polymerase III subunit delta [Brevibacillus choshinensis]|uniref:DNA polymerase III subunit delta n=1 Tax=Brevibacillus choshinensis TaxID=54911 RepID=A0ABX7FTF9_BRECH|nr:DNA polymerase III subunit delta [Brevibacillus choshinensis]QRG69529.1 DNA polymerase III subunit delta [Brevibacillus choshinensis]